MDKAKISCRRRLMDHQRDELRSSAVLGPRQIGGVMVRLPVTPKSTTFSISSHIHCSQPVIMSHEALPIDRVRFSEALESLPLDALYAKVAELRNNMDHLRYSNEQMVPFADEGDQGVSKNGRFQILCLTRTKTAKTPCTRISLSSAA